MKREESMIQKIVVDFIRRKYPEIIFTSAPAVAKSPRQGHENKLMGYWKGFPDLFIACPVKGYYGLFIELKTAKGKVSPEQETTIIRLTNSGYKAIICRSPEEAIIEINKYMKII